MPEIHHFFDKSWINYRINHTFSNKKLNSFLINLKCHFFFNITTLSDHLVPENRHWFQKLVSMFSQLWEGVHQNLKTSDKLNQPFVWFPLKNISNFPHNNSLDGRMQDCTTQFRLVSKTFRGGWVAVNHHSGKYLIFHWRSKCNEINIEM